MTAQCPICNSEAKHLFEKNTYNVFKCRKCGLGFIYPLPTIREIEAFYILLSIER